MFSTRTLLLFLAVLLLAVLVTAAPIPVEGLSKKSLKQYKAKRGEPPTRVGRDLPKPSGYTARGVSKRDDAALPKPSKGYKR
ncbi:hypothetical protein B0H10DRAFT_2216100 [Mycena sp. CBHHK59/15]|nr:hypothetical protein B0H10DRAFT_2216100 [Mycena sp. CBHHK59/15]